MPRARLSAQQRAIRVGQEDRQILYPINPGPQEAFMRATAEESLYGGAMGGGKSYALRAWGVTYCLTHPGAQVVLFRQNYKQLEDTHILKIQQEIPESIAMYASGSHDLIFHNGSILQFRYCEADVDVRKYYTAEYDAMLFDEITEFTEYQYVNLVTRCRSTKSWWPGRRIRCGGMPLGIGHGWVKNRWIDHDTPNEVWRGPANEGGMSRLFIPAKVQDNPTFMKADPDYVTMLRQLPEEEYRARALGDWTVSLDQFFTRWRDEVHTCVPFDIPSDWDHFLCVDYGYNAPYAAYWFARPPGTTTAIVYREQYGKGIDLTEQVFRAWQATTETEEKLRAVILDPSMFGKVNVKGARVAPMADDWKAKFGSLVVRGNNERVSGWHLMREMIDWKEDPNGGILIPPRLRFFHSCPNAIRTLPRLSCSKQNLEDIDTNSEDHSADALRYGLMFAYQGNARAGLSNRISIDRKGVHIT